MQQNTQTRSDATIDLSNTGTLDRMMTVYVVVPVHNRRDYTRACLECLHAQNFYDIKIIVVDDGSTDRTGDMIEAKFPTVTLLRGDGNLWWVGAANLGIRHALQQCNSDDYILVINDDLVVSEHYISSLVRAADSHPNTIIGSVETTADEPDRIWKGGNTVNWKTAKFRILNRGRRLDEFPRGHTVEVDTLTGRGTLFPSRALRETGLYDEVHFRQCGDTELPVRARFKFGYRLLVAYDGVVVSNVSQQRDINNAQYYTLPDFGEYFFDIRSHFNIRDRYWFARDVSPNPIWFARYFTLSVVRTAGRYLLRLRFNHN